MPIVFIPGDIGNYYYGQGHPMKPHRMRMTHNLLLNYGLYRKMEIYRPHKATQVKFLPGKVSGFHLEIEKALVRAPPSIIG